MSHITFISCVSSLLVFFFIYLGPTNGVSFFLLPGTRTLLQYPVDVRVAGFNPLSVKCSVSLKPGKPCGFVYVVSFMFMVQFNYSVGTEFFKAVCIKLLGFLQ